MKLDLSLKKELWFALASWSSGMCCREVWEIGTCILEKPAAPFFYTGDVGERFHLNGDTCLLDYTALHLLISTVVMLQRKLLRSICERPSACPGGCPPGIHRARQQTISSGIYAAHRYRISGCSISTVIGHSRIISVLQISFAQDLYTGTLS
jgi:hypothetical protein